MNIKVEVEYKTTNLPAEICLNVQNGNITNEDLQSIQDIKDPKELMNKLSSILISII